MNSSTNSNSSAAPLYIAGVGMTRFGRLMDRTLRSLALDAAQLALDDAGIAATDVQAVFFGNAGQGAVEGQHSIRAQVALKTLPLGNAAMFNIDNACASSSTALHLAASYIRAEQCDIALVIGAEKMCTPDKAASMEVFRGSWDVSDVAGTRDVLSRLGAELPTPPDAKESAERSVFMDVYQAFTKFHMAAFGTTMEQIAHVASKNHQHSTLNPLAHYRKSFTVEEVLNARLIAWPLTLPMCSPVSDGASAAVLCSAKAMRRLGGRRAVQLRASVSASGGRRAPQDYRSDVAHLVARQAYEIAGVDPSDISIAEVHDATAFGEIQQIENLMLCEFGGGGALSASGATSLGGRVPVNTSGGLESRGHPIGATGLAQIHELVTQLRGEAGARQVAGAKVAVAENGGGLLGAESATCCVTVLSV